MILAIANEITNCKDFIADKNIETIYFGGGTPSLLNANDFKIIFDAIHAKFTVSKNAEITLEANPDDIGKNILSMWQLLGINRLSVGLQSFNDTELKWMNRAHNAAQSLQCLDYIEAAGFTNISVDLIYGSPLQSNKDLIENFNLIAQRNIKHISCYALTVENKTALHKLIKEKKCENVNSESQAKHFKLLLTLMKANGYEQYEISNFCKPGFRSKHNSSYWQGKAYFGFGPSAHSYNGNNKRRWNVANNSLYLQNNNFFEEEILLETDMVNEYVMTSLRTSEGLDIDFVAKKFGKEHSERILLAAKKYLQMDRLIVDDSTLKLTNDGKFFADGISSDLFV